MNKSNVQLELCIYGDGILRDELQKITEQLELEEEVKFCGYIPNNEVPKILSNCKSSMSIKYIRKFWSICNEAMACEVPVIATNTPGFSEVIENNVTGFIVPIKNEKEMARKILNVINITVMNEKI